MLSGNRFQHNDVVGNMSNMLLFFVSQKQQQIFSLHFCLRFFVAQLSSYIYIYMYIHIHIYTETYSVKTTTAQFRCSLNDYKGN